MADDDMAAADIKEHFRGDFPGEGTFSLPVAVLGRELYAAVGNDPADPLKDGEYRGDDYLHSGCPGNEGFESSHQFDRLNGRFEQFPVAGNNGFAHIGFPYLSFTSRALTPGSTFPSSSSRKAPPPVEM